MIKYFDLCFSKDMYSWVHQVLDLGSYKDTSVRLDFVTLTDDSLISYWYLDDISLSTSSINPLSLMDSNPTQAMTNEAADMADGTLIPVGSLEHSQEMKAILQQSIMRNRMHYSKMDRIQ